MIILIQSSTDTHSVFQVDRELQRAFNALHSGRVRVLGGGRFMDGSGYIVLAHEEDGPAAFGLLATCGIGAVELKPRIGAEAHKPRNYATRQR